MHVAVCIVVVSVLCLPVLSNALKAEIIHQNINKFQQNGQLHLHGRWKRETESVAFRTTCPEVQGLVERRIEGMNNSTRKLFSDEVEFTGDKKFSLQMAWTGYDNERIIVITSEGGLSSVYLSDETSKKFENISDRLQGATVNYQLSLWKHPIESKLVFIVANSLFLLESSLYVSEDGGTTFVKVPLPFYASGTVTSHPSNSQYILIDDVHTHQLFLSKDRGHTWKKIKSSVISYKWATMPNSSDIFVLTGETYIFTDSKTNVLEKSSDLGDSWTSIYRSVYSFGIGGKFLYTSVFVSSDSRERRLLVSRDAGITWNHVLLPTITPDRFFSILDFSGGQIFLHVDDPGDTGKGTLYLSDATGISFSKSLENHLYPNFQDATDFYVVQSMRGVYIANQLADDNSIHTVISYNRGADWQSVERPKDVQCLDETKKCYLQIHNVYSRQRGVRASAPMSVLNAVGIILVHGHIAEALQTSDPDVFISSDGGYTWRLALKGPHHYAIGDHGGLLVAVPVDTPTPSVIKFSTDEGHCWISYNFTEGRKRITFTGLLVEPGHRAMMVAIWGYSEDRTWHTYYINFTALIDRQCDASQDYEDWVAHSHHAGGCLLGYNETFKRLKTDSWCYNGKAYSVSSTRRTCPCTADDFDCDFGYMRQGNTEKCVEDSSLINEKVHICRRNHEDTIVAVGYHKIPGDGCKGGYFPNDAAVINLVETCQDDSSSKLSSETKVEVKTHSTAGMLVAIFVLFGIIALIVVATLYAKKRRMASHAYHYMSIKADDVQPLNGNRAVNTSTSIYDNSSDDDEPVLS